MACRRNADALIVIVWILCTVFWRLERRYMTCLHVAFDDSDIKGGRERKGRASFSTNLFSLYSSDPSLSALQSWETTACMIS